MIKNYGLLGHPLSHSLSPQIHRRLFELCGDKFSTYELFDVDISEMGRFFHGFNNLDGFNVTIPYKIDMYEKLMSLDQTAKRYGAVNTVKRLENGLYRGYNTDIDGFLKSIESEGISLCGEILLLGFGGVGKMAAVETVSQKGSLTIALRNPSSPKVLKFMTDLLKIQKDAKIKIVNINKIPKINYDLLINATPCGMFPNMSEIPVSFEICKKCSTIFDLIYNPTQTVLMKTGKMFGAKVVGGMTMLVWQAVFAHKIWNGSIYNKKDIKNLISDMKNR